MLKNLTHAIIYVYYNDKKYKSLKLDLSDESVLELIEKLSTIGTNELSMLKFPTTKKKIIIFSKEQLKSCVVELELFEKEKSKVKDDLILS